MSTLGFKTYLEKIYAGWVGKSLGGIIGAPIEGHKAFGDFNGIGSFPSKLYPNDDLDIQVIWLELLEKEGTSLNHIDLAHYWKKHCWYNFAEYGVFLNNYDKGIMPPMSGSFNNGYYYESMGCPIRAEIWGMICPDMPEDAVGYAALDGSLDHSGLSIVAEQYWAACVSLAFTETSLDDLLRDGFKYINNNPILFSLYEFVCEISGRYSAGEISLHDLWMILVRRYGNRDASKMIMNFAITLVSLLIGRDDFVLTINTAINMGWDADCTAATAGALLGVLYGEKVLPAEWKKRMGDKLTCDVDVHHKNADLHEFAENTALVGIEKLIDSDSLNLISDIPDDVMNKVNQRKSSRKIIKPFKIEIDYIGEPVLYHMKPAFLSIVLNNQTDSALLVNYTLKPENHMEIAGGCPDRGDTILPPNGNAIIPVSAISSAREIHDKNIIEVALVSGNYEEHINVGFGGARAYMIYGPYWDIYDKEKFDVCPYRNEKEYCHPAFRECFYYLEHQYVSLDDKYLDEEALFAGTIQEESPIRFETGTDYFEISQVINFSGEACYYLVRDVFSEVEKEVNITIGTNCPFLLYIDGMLAIKNNKEQAYAPRDFFFKTDVSGKRRIVIKILSKGADIKFGMSFSVLDCVKDKSEGLSYMSSEMIDYTLL